MLRLDEIRESIKIITQALDGLPEGDFKNKKAKLTYKPPAGETYTRIENSRGEMGIYLISDGSKKPLRVKAKGASFNHLQVLPHYGANMLIAIWSLILQLWMLFCPRWIDELAYCHIGTHTDI